MKKDPLIFLTDILFSINLIEEYIKDSNLKSFEEHYGTQDKVMHRLEIIAESAKRLPEETRLKYNSIPWKSIIGLRNIITHTYDEVNLQEIWEIITKHLPETKKQIEQIKTDLQK